MVRASGKTDRNSIKTVLFDYGGVLATEGFRRGLEFLARRFELDPDRVYRAGSEAVYESGYVLGRGTEQAFWALMSRKVGLPPYEPYFTDIILSRFRLRPAMILAVRAAKRKGLGTAVLSDQTDWLDRLEKRDVFFHEFDRVFNSYHMGAGKKNPAVFPMVLEELGRRPGEVLFIDDNPGHIDRARAEGLMAWRFVRQDRFLRRFEKIFLS